LYCTDGAPPQLSGSTRVAATVGPALLMVTGSVTTAPSLSLAVSVQVPKGSCAAV
jgi:hypothetical protein